MASRRSSHATSTSGTSCEEKHELKIVDGIASRWPILAAAGGGLGREEVGALRSSYRCTTDKH